ncbi:hypothetical protein FA15DRAFT_81187 [Coprinopsis marcescibilis]|uniref:Uncharacterized protein n=1 Tax=Coprinopsis marcescibilis TaxID=230819 RepID=A0A5C3KLZ9_COPMA|nr:hypothetical protein FA15DRAFT_81187 [Coprinopsis marcescibilis]
MALSYSQRECLYFYDSPSLRKRTDRRFGMQRSHASSNSMLLSLMSHLNPTVRGTLTSLMIAYEFIAFVLATYKGYTTMRVDGPVWGQRKTLNYLIFKQGTD